MKPKVKVSLKRYTWPSLAMAVAITICLAAYIVLSPPRKAPTEPEIVTYSTNSPSEDKPGENFQWAGALDEPKKILIPDIGVDAYIQKVGVDQNQEMAAPNNIHIAGWFVDTVKPGERGLSIIGGHIDGLSQPAVFARLPEITENTEIIIEFGDGSTKQFQVISLKEVSATDAPPILFSQDTKTSHQLNLITCTGKFDKQARRYENRVIISAALK